MWIQTQRMVKIKSSWNWINTLESQTHEEEKNIYFILCFSRLLFFLSTIAFFILRFQFGFLTGKHSSYVCLGAVHRQINKLARKRMKRETNHSLTFFLFWIFSVYVCWLFYFFFSKWKKKKTTKYYSFARVVPFLPLLDICRAILALSLDAAFFRIFIYWIFCCCWTIFLVDDGSQEMNETKNPN